MGRGRIILRIQYCLTFRSNTIRRLRTELPIAIVATDFSRSLLTPSQTTESTNGRLFSYKTRVYLRRRVARYFRLIGFQHPKNYSQSVAAVLELYRDDDVATGENILDNWTLMHIAFRCSSILQFERSRVEVTDGRSLGELTAAPQFDEIWNEPGAATILLKFRRRVASTPCRPSGDCP